MGRVKPVYIASRLTTTRPSVPWLQQSPSVLPPGRESHAMTNEAAEIGLTGAKSPLESVTRGMMDGVRSLTAGSAMLVLSVRVSIRHFSVRCIHQSNPASQEVRERTEQSPVAVTVIVCSSIVYVL